MGPDNTAQRRTVELGDTVEGARIVRTGLAAHDQVIVGGTQFVREDTPVAPLPATPSALLTQRQAQEPGGPEA